MSAASTGWPGTARPMVPHGAVAADRLGPLEAEVARLRQERDELQGWVFHLERLAKAGLLAGGLAHDVGNLLTSLVAGSELALLRDDPTHHRRALEQNASLSRHAADTLRAFLEFARRDAVRQQALRLSEVVEDALRFLAPPLREGRVTVVRRFEGDDQALGSRTLLLQAVVNLVLNAVKALAPRGGLIEVRVRRAGGRVALSVRDDGPGIPEAIRTRLFQPFVSGAASGDVRPQAWRSGTGLGLFVTRRIVEEMGGRIGVRTRSGEGTVFRVVLRAAPAPQGGKAHHG